MLFLTLLSYVAIVVQVVFGTIGIAAGLYYLAELVEEYTTLAKKSIWWLNFVILLIYFLLGMFENFPVIIIIFGILAQISHFWILESFPFVSFCSFGFVMGVILVVVNHFLAFHHFANVYHPFSEVMTYFTLCLWLVPFTLFISLSANDNVLPTISDQRDDVVSRYLSKTNKRSCILSLFNYIKETISSVKVKKSF